MSADEPGKIYVVTSYEPMTAPTSAEGWTAVYEDIDSGEPDQDPLVGWVLCGVVETTRQNTVDGKSTRGSEILREQRRPNQICGLVSSDSGVDPPEEIMNFRGYRHRSQSLEQFCKNYFHHAKWREDKRQKKGAMHN